MIKLAYILFFIPIFGFSQTQFVESADANGIVTVIEIDLKDFQRLSALPSWMDSVLARIASMQLEIDSLKGSTPNEPVALSEYEIMIEYLRNNSLSAFNKEYTEREIVDIAKDIDFLPAFIKTTSGSKSEKVEYLLTLL